MNKVKKTTMSKKELEEYKIARDKISEFIYSLCQSEEFEVRSVQIALLDYFIGNYITSGATKAEFLEIVEKNFDMISKRIAAQ